MNQFSKITLLFFLVLIAVSCNKNGEAKAGGVIHLYEHSDNEAIVGEMVNKYQELHPEIEVRVTIIPNNNYDDEILIPLNANAEFDVLWVRGGSQMKEYAQDGLLYPLDDLLTEKNLSSEVYGSLAEAFKLEGKTYGLPTSKSCWLLWYNQDLFDAAGEAYPIGLTWQEYTDLAEKLKTESIYGSIYPPWIMNLGASAMGEYLTDPDLERTLEYTKYMEEWFNPEGSHLSIPDMSGSFDINEFFAGGKSYMMINGDWEFMILPDYNPEFTWAAAPLPVFDDASGEATVGDAGCLSIPAGSKNPELAFDFIQFFCHSDEGAAILASNAQVSAYPSEKALQVYKKSIDVPGVQYVFSADVGMEAGPEDYYDKLNELFKTEVKDALVLGIPMNKMIEDFKTKRAQIQNKQP